ncbi:hypothetical protein GYMLUDRAFT_173741, partial [Collybiopsis luxurians FD-317 M1]
AHIDSDKICLKDTRVEIINKISNWIYVTGKNIPRGFFLYGPAGTGKSAISHTIGKQCKDENCLGAFFRFDRTFTVDRTPSKALQSIAYNLALYIPEFGNRLVELLDKDPYVSSSPSLKEQWQNLILKPAQSMLESKQVVIVIDALDECGHQQRDSTRMKFLSVLMDGINELPQNFRVLVTSRLEGDIAEILEKYGNLLQAQDMSALVNTKNDIYKYVVHRMERSINQGNFNLDQCRTLAERAENHFQWAYTVCEALHQQVKPGIKVRKRFERFMAMQANVDEGFNPLDQLYKSILQEIFDSEDENVMNEYRKVMAQVLAASKPLSKAALRNLQVSYLHYIEEDDEEQGVDAVIPWLGSLLTGVNQSDVPIQPVHTSIRDFLLDKDRSGIYAIEIENGHKIMAAGSIKLMTEQLHFNICNLPSSYLLNSQIINLEQLISAGISAELEYACCYWHNHLVENPGDASVLVLFKTFLFKYSLFWMEVLGILNQPQVILRSMENMMQWIQLAIVSLLCVVTEINQFGYIFGKMMAESTPHLYISALPFLPQQSALKKIYSLHFHNLATICEGHKIHWPSQQISLQLNGEVISVAFSPNGKRIIAGTDRSVQIWEIETGTLMGSLQHTDSVMCLDFSSDGRRIVSGLIDGLVCIWSTETESLVCSPMLGHTGPVTSVAFSPDGKRVVSGSYYQSLLIWDVETGTPLDTLQGPKSIVYSVAFSPDSKKIVTGSFESSLQVWDAVTGHPVGDLLQGHTGPVISVAFSPDGSRIVSGSYDKSLLIWDIETGTVIGSPLQGHTDSVNSVAFSPDGETIVSGSRDHSVQLWDVKTGFPIGNPFQGHAASVNSVAFSPDGKRIVTGSDDSSVRLWDAHPGQLAQDLLHGHTGSVESVGFSPDGKQIVSGSQDNTVQIWDTKTGDPMGKPLQGHTKAVVSVAFSPDGKKIVSGSRDESVLIWNTETGNRIGNPLQGHTDWVTSVAFSPDGKRIVSGSYDWSVRIWDAETGNPIGNPLQGHMAHVYSVAFSPDGKQIGSGSDDDSVRIWDVDAGISIGKPLQINDELFAVAFSPNGKNIACVSGQNVFLRNDGWICGSDSSLLLWIPPEYQAGLRLPHMKLLISRADKASLDLSKFVHGTNWTACFKGHDLSTDPF